MLSKFSRSRSPSLPSSPSSPPLPDSPSKPSGLPKPWPSCLPLPLSRSRKRDFSLQPASLSSPPPAGSPSLPSRPSLHNLSPALVLEIQQVFAQFDANNDGRISADELCAVLRCFGDNASDAEALQMVEEVDPDGDGFISFDEFVELNTRSLRATGELASIDELTATFDMFDLDKNGCITAEELHSVLMNLGDRDCTVEDCKRMIRGVDRKGAGHVDFDDFKRMMMTSA